MTDNEMLYCLIAFILGWLVSRHMGNGFSVGGDTGMCVFNEDYNFADIVDEGYTLTQSDLADTALACTGIGSSDLVCMKGGAAPWCKLKTDLDK